jgi:subtilase family serine protease
MIRENKRALDIGSSASPAWRVSWPRAARTALVVLLAASFMAAQPLAAAGGTAGSPGTRTVTVAPQIPAGAGEIGAVSASATQTAEVVLRPRDEEALTRFIAAVTDSGSPLFRQYLRPGEFASEFGPSQAAIGVVTSWLRAAGLQVTSVASDGLLIDVRASASQVERAFGTGLERFRLADGSIGQATTGAVRLPSSIAGAVAAVVGLNSVVRLRPLGLVRASTSVQGPHPAATAPSFSHSAGSPTACADA